MYVGGGILLILLAVALPGQIGTAPRRRRLPGDPSWWAAAALPAVGGALAAAVVPVERLLPIAVAGRLALLLATQGVLALLFLRLTRAAAFASILPPAPSRWTTVLRTTLIVLAVLAALTVTVGYPTQTYLLQVLPAGDRWWLLTICAATAVPYAIADAALTAHRGAPRAAGVLTLSGLFVTWLVAVVLTPGELGFLLVVGPLLAAFLTCCTMLAALVRRRTGLVAPGVAIRSLTFGWIVCVTFPLTV